MLQHDGNDVKGFSENKAKKQTLPLYYVGFCDKMNKIVLRGQEGQSVSKEKKGRMWLRLDNAAKIFPAAMRPGWSNVFRLSVTFLDRVDPEVLKSALEKTVPRFPSICARLGQGFFWFYLEQGTVPPTIQEEGCQPLLPMKKSQMKRCALRVLYYENRVSVEFFHALTDGSGALVFLKTLAAVYIEEKYGVPVPCENGVLDIRESAKNEELEDAFLRYVGKVTEKRRGSFAFRLTGEPEPDGFLHVTSATIPVKEVLFLAKEKGVSLTALLSACFCLALCRIQKQKKSRGRKAVRVQIPVNLRQFFPSQTLRNFVSVVNVGVEKGEDDMELDELVTRVHHQMGLLVTPRHLRAVFSPNVLNEQEILIRVVPLFMKNVMMRAVFDRVGESLACICLSNLGAVAVPDVMRDYVTRMDFIIGPQAKAPYNCAVLSYGENLQINIVRNSVEPELEREFFRVLKELGIGFTLESNER